MTDLRPVVCAALRADEVTTANAFRARAIAACAATVAAGQPFGDADTAKAVLGGRISARMLQRVVELVGSGHADPGSDRTRAAAELMTITCIGRAAALRLAAKGVTSVSDLAARTDDPDLALTAAQRLCVRYRDDIARRVPRSEMNAHAARVADAARAAGCEAHVVGSYRRNADSSGDVDVLLVGDLDAFLTPLFADGYVVGTIARGACKFNGLARLPNAPHARRLDVLRTTERELPFALLHFTGPDVYNVALRRVAMAAGKRLSEKGLTGLEGARSEADVVNALGVEYQNPQDRGRDAPLRSVP